MEERREEKRREEKRRVPRPPSLGCEAARIAGFTLGILLSTIATASGEALIPICETGFAGSNIYSGSINGHLDGNDIYMRYAAAEYLGSGNDSLVDNYFVLGWVSSRDPSTGLRTLWVGMVRDWPPQSSCQAVGTPVNPSVPSSSTPYPVDLEGVVDVGWVHHGGHVPAGQVEKTAYPSHGYLVWSSMGDEQTQPRVVAGRFWQQGGWLHFESVPLGRRFPAGITPSMASNRPLPINQEYTSADRGGPYYYNPALVCQLAGLFERVFGVDVWSACDYGHRLALVYSGDPRWITERKTNLEYAFCDWSDPNQDCRFWVGSTIRYKIFRPGDDQVLHEGVLADIRNNPDYDDVLDHAVYPEIVWNEATQQWLVVWEEAYLDRSFDPSTTASHWKARTLDPAGNLGPVVQLGVCRKWTTPTSLPPDTQPGSGGESDPATHDDDRPPPARIQRNYCYPMSLANDYYSLDAMPWAGDRNPSHLSLFSNYLVRPSAAPDGIHPAPFHWIADDPQPPAFVDNPWGTAQAYNGHFHMQSISVIGNPSFRDQTPYDQASYLKVNYDRDTAYGCRNEFYLISDRPGVRHDEGGNPDQQYYRVEDTAPWDTDCTARLHWGSASSAVGLVSLWSQYVPSQQRWEMRFGTYLWSVPGH